MDNLISVKFTGEGLTLENISFVKLSDFIEDYFKILISLNEEKLSLLSNKDCRYSLVNIKPGSVELGFMVSEESQLKENNFELIDAIQNQAVDTLPAQTRQQIYDYSKKLLTHEIPLAVSLFSRTGIIVVFDPNLYKAESIKYQSSEVIYGELTDVGGSDPNVHLKTDYGSLKCEVSKEQAIQLGARLYTNIGLLCDVYRNHNEENPNRIIVKEILPYDETKWESNISELQEIFSKRFRDVNVEEYFRDMRRE